MNAVLLAAIAGCGMYLLFSALALGRRGLRRDRTVVGAATTGRPSGRRATREWLLEAGLSDVQPANFAVVVVLLGVVGGAGGYLLFASLLPTLVAGVVAAALPVSAYRNRRIARLEHAQEAWPGLLEEIRLLTTSVGRSLPQATFDVGGRAPAELRNGFEVAQREWLLSTDFGRALDVLRARLADPTADAVCETLLVAHEVGGNDLGRRLQDLAEDRYLDVMGRKDARAKQSGVRFARRFVLVVPVGMAIAGSMIGSGRSAYATATGQLVVGVAVVFLVACWFWAGRYLRLPNAGRVFTQHAEARA